ncbi:hypothetical protein [Providencia rettgeri]|uniref:hypothetical protein n=1 Tax=Providencia rettgeri TaxID=587 RepID=UPI00301A3350
MAARVIVTIKENDKGNLDFDISGVRYGAAMTKREMDSGKMLAEGISIAINALKLKQEDINDVQ